MHMYVCLVAGGGVQWSTIAKGVSIDDPFSMAHVIVMLLIDAVIYFVIAWYIEAVFPGEFGVPKPWYFPVTVRRVVLCCCLLVCSCQSVTVCNSRECASDVSDCLQRYIDRLWCM